MPSARRSLRLLMAAVAVAPLVMGANGTTAAVAQTPGLEECVEPHGYRMAAADGGVFAFGHLAYLGSASTLSLNGPVVGIAETPARAGYWLAASDGGVFSFGDADYFGSMAGTALNQPVIGMARTPSGRGYWLAAKDGGVFAFGDAQFYGSGASLLGLDVRGFAVTPSGRGYWLLRSSSVLAYGDARAYPPLPGSPTSVASWATMAPTPSGQGYWIVTFDGDVLTRGDAQDFGSIRFPLVVQTDLTGPFPYIREGPGTAPAVAIHPTPSGLGYHLLSSQGGIWDAGDAVRCSRFANERLNQPMVGMA